MMQIRRYKYRNRDLYLGFGCLASLALCFIVVVIGALIIIPVLPTIGMRLMGFTAQGETQALFSEVTPVEPVPLENPIEVSQATINLGAYGTQNLPPDPLTYTIEIGSMGGSQAATVNFTEAGLMELCRNSSEICRNGDSRFRNVRLDLKPGGAIVYADVALPDINISQNVGVVLRLDTPNARFTVAGVDVGGILYQVPPSNMGELVSEVERVGNDVLRQLTLQAAGEHFTLTEVYIDETQLTMVMR
jgi:hypothetical protein